MLNTPVPYKIEQHALLFAQEKMPSAMDDYDINYHKLELEVSNTSTYLRNGRVTTRATCVVPYLRRIKSSCPIT